VLVVALAALAIGFPRPVLAVTLVFSGVVLVTAKLIELRSSWRGPALDGRAAAAEPAGGEASQADGAELADALSAKLQQASRR
jgi:hypothetical protein